MTEASKMFVFAGFTFICASIGCVFAYLFATKRKILVEAIVSDLLSCTNECEWLPRIGKTCQDSPMFSIAWSYNTTNYTGTTDSLPFYCSGCCNASVGAPLLVQIDAADPSTFIHLWEIGEWPFITFYEEAFITCFVFALVCLCASLYSVIAKRPGNASVRATDEERLPFAS
jgi:hypothetical protein